jgi:hypothetical protein
MDTSYADAIARLNDEVSSACSRVSDDLSDKEIAAELRRIADELEAH